MKVLKWLGGIVAVLALVLVGVGVWAARASFPTVDGEIAVAGFDDAVTVRRDARGVPHVSAVTEHDLYMAQGYVHAQDRFHQMDFWRHIGQARLSEMLGASTVDSDRFLRALDFASIAEAEYAALPDEGRASLDAYAEGVNAWMADRSGARLSLEHFLLGLLYGYEPEPWTPIDTLTWARMMAWDLRSNIDEEIDRAALAGVVGADRAEQLYPPLADDKDTILGGILPNGAVSSLVLATPEVLTAPLERVSAAIAAVEQVTGTWSRELGSNNWVVGGALTESGLPLLADDPHLSTQMPSIWYEMGLHCDCGVRTAGYSFAGVPGIVIGHNERIAWAVTNVGPDTMDLFVEKVNPDNREQYEHLGEWVDFEMRQEVIEVAGGRPVTVMIRSTVHGPVITDLYGALDNVTFESSEPWVIALQWAALEPSTLLDAVYSMNRAADWDEFRAAAAKWDIAPQNLLYADVDGNIGYQTPGRVPIRRSGDGRWPVPGWTGEHDWVGYIPFEELPSVLNPTSGYIASANQPIVPVGTGPWLGADFDLGYRGTRIYRMLDELTAPVTVDDLAAMQQDTHNGSAAELVPYLLAVEADGVADAQRLLAGWSEGDDAFTQDVDSAPAALYAVIWRQLLARTFHDELPEDLHPGGGTRWFAVVRNLMDSPDDPWWDDVTTEQQERRDDILAAAIAAGWDETAELLGRNPDRWAWGDLHITDFDQQTLGVSGIGPIEALFNRGGVRTPGGSGIVNATSWDATEGDFRVTALPSLRMVTDLADFDRSIGIHTTGQSGRPFHRHYFDLADDWAGGVYHPMPWSEAAVETATVDILRLVPAGP